MLVDIPYLTFVHNHGQTGDPYIMWWEDDSWLTPYGGVTFGGWAINYLLQNTTVSFEVFQNQFMSISEGQDGDAFDANYWNDPNLTFPPQTLPTFAAFEASYPKHDDPLYDTPIDLYTAIGGNILAQYNTDPPKYQNTCALRISKALNYSGVIIPNIPGKTFKGADNKYYFLGASTLLAWMKKTFGTPTGSNHLTGTQGGNYGTNFPNLLAGKKGIYIMTPNYPGLFGASGHADMINNSVCDGGCYFDGDPGGVYKIFIWELL